MKNDLQNALFQLKEKVIAIGKRNRYKIVLFVALLIISLRGFNEESAFLLLVLFPVELYKFILHINFLDVQIPAYFKPVLYFLIALINTAILFFAYISIQNYFKRKKQGNNRKHIRSLLKKIFQPIRMLMSACFLMVLSGIVWVFGVVFSGAGHGPEWAFQIVYMGAISFILANFFVFFCLLILFIKALASKSNKISKKLLILGIALVFILVLYKPFINKLMFDAAFKGNEKRCQFLLKIGADKNPGFLFIAARWGHLSVVKLLLENGFSANLRLGGNGDSMLEAAVDNLSHRADGNIEIIKILLDKGADPNQKSNDGRNILQRILQTSGREKEIIRLIIDRGINVNSEDYYGTTALHQSVENDDLNDISKLLIVKGAYVNAKDENGNTPIFGAGRCDNFEIVKYLIENGANIKIVNKNRQNFLDYTGNFNSFSFDKIKEYLNSKKILLK